MTSYFVADVTWAEGIHLVGSVHRTAIYVSSWWSLLLYLPTHRRRRLYQTMPKWSRFQRSGDTCISCNLHNSEPNLWDTPLQPKCSQSIWFNRRSVWDVFRLFFVLLLFLSRMPLLNGPVPLSSCLWALMSQRGMRLLDKTSAQKIISLPKRKSALRRLWHAVKPRHLYMKRS